MSENYEYAYAEHLPATSFGGSLQQSANFKCQIQINEILKQPNKNFSWPFEEEQCLWKQTSFRFNFTEGVEMNFEGELVISPYAWYFLWKNQFVSLQT